MQSGLNDFTEQVLDTLVDSKKQVIGDNVDVETDWQLQDVLADAAIAYQDEIVEDTISNLHLLVRIGRNQELIELLKLWVNEDIDLGREMHLRKMIKAIVAQLVGAYEDE